jgi:hypothetical protein
VIQYNDEIYRGTNWIKVSKIKDPLKFIFIIAKFMNLKIKKDVRYQKNNVIRTKIDHYIYTLFQILLFCIINKSYLDTDWVKISGRNDYIKSIPLISKFMDLRIKIILDIQRMISLEHWETIEDISISYFIILWNN